MCFFRVNVSLRWLNNVIGMNLVEVSLLLISQHIKTGRDAYSGLDLSIRYVIG